MNDFRGTCRDVTLLMLFSLIFRAWSQTGQFTCGVAAGREPNLADETCQTYYACAGYVGRLRRCRAGQQFDFAQRRCGAEDDVWCADQLEDTLPQMHTSPALDAAAVTIRTNLPVVNSTRFPVNTTQPSHQVTEHSSSRGGRRNGGRLGTILRIFFPQLFIPTQRFVPGVAGVAPRTFNDVGQLGQPLAPPARGDAPQAENVGAQEGTALGPVDAGGDLPPYVAPNLDGNQVGN